MHRTSAISSASYDRLLDICAAASCVYPPIDPLHPGPPPVYLAPVVVNQRVFQGRAHQLLAQELVAFLATTDRTRNDRDATAMYLRSGSGAPGGLSVARFFYIYGCLLPFTAPGCSTPQVPGPYMAYLATCGEVSAGLAQLESDIAASAAADMLIDPELAAEAAGRLARGRNTPGVL